jgi:hypothetical protein
LKKEYVNIVVKFNWLRKELKCRDRV